MKKSFEYLPFPEQCPYNSFCEVKDGIEAAEELTGGLPVRLCNDMNYTLCPSYATQFRSDILNMFTNGIAGAMLKHLNEHGLEMLTDEEIGGIHDIVIRGFDGAEQSDEEDN